MTPEIERIRAIKSFPSLVTYLRDELNWKIEAEDIDELTFEYDPDDLGLDKATTVKIKEIKQLRPLVTNQPWGIFYISFEKKRLPIVVLRRILRSLVLKKRASANRSGMATWELNDLLFISSYGDEEDRELSFAHFSEDTVAGDLPSLKVLGWNAGNTALRLENTYQTLKEKLRWPDDETDTDEWRKQWAAAFTRGYRQTVKTSKELAIRLADLAQVIRERVNEAIAIESEKGELRKLHKAFQDALIHDLSTDDFADMYAQTIAYGLLSASVSRESGALVADNLKDMVPKTNPFLQELMGTFLTVGGRKGKIDFDELGINEVIELLRNTDMDQVKLDFGAKNPNEDPVIHFYELFLKEYDPEKRMKRGVFYTPRPVVSFIVRSVDEILRTEFGLEDGLADTTTWGEMKRRNKDLEIPEGAKETSPFVQILDPATGTGTFLVEVIDLVYKTMTEKWKSQRKADREIRELWNEYVPRHLLPRVYGFELMMAPYSIAHMKIGLKLRETGYSFISSERAQVFLTNALEEAHEAPPYLESMAPALAHEAEAANRVKQRAPITVIIGNPPYSGESMNKGTWIRGLIDDYMYVDGHHLNEKGKKNWLQDDYVKFLRASQFYLSNQNAGVLGMITNHSWLLNPTFRGMRQSFLQSFNSLHLIDLHGNSKKKEKSPNNIFDENVFDIQQGVAITFGAKLPSDDTGAEILHLDLWGDRAASAVSGNSRETAVGGKYGWLLKNSVSTCRWNDVASRSPLYLFTPQNDDLGDEYRSGMVLTEISPHFGVGVITSRDHFVTDFDGEKILERLNDFRDPALSDDTIAKTYEIKDNSMWSLSEARKRFREKPIDRSLLVDMLYRPFDQRSIYYETNVVFNMRTQVMKHMLIGHNLGICTTRTVEIGRGFEHAFCTSQIIQHHTVSIKEVNHLFPLYLYHDENEGLGFSGRETNLSSEFVANVTGCLRLRLISDGRGDLQETVGAEDIFHYIYAVLHSPAYRARYAEFLKIDFPRIPLTNDVDLFRKLCQLGCDLVALHLLEPDYEGTSWTRQNKMFPTENHRFKFKGNDDGVAAGHPKYDADNERVYINKTSYFAGIPEAVWNFHIGGYQVCHKWLKDRKGRSLSLDDQLHYNKIAIALGETIRIMSEIDKVIDAHGGWPLRGSSDG